MPKHYRRKSWWQVTPFWTWWLIRIAAAIIAGTAWFVYIRS